VNQLTSCDRRPGRNNDELKTKTDQRRRSGLIGSGWGKTVYGVKDLRLVLIQEWKSEGVMDNENGESTLKKTMWNNRRGRRVLAAAGSARRN